MCCVLCVVLLDTKCRFYCHNSTMRNGKAKHQICRKNWAPCQWSSHWYPRVCFVSCVLCVVTYHALTYHALTLFSSSLLQEYHGPMLAATRVSSSSNVQQLARVKCARSDGQNGGGTGNVYLDGGTGNVCLDPPSQSRPAKPDFRYTDQAVQLCQAVQRWQGVFMPGCAALA